MRHAFGHSPRVHKNQLTAMLVDQFDDAGVDLIPLLVHADRPEFTRRHFDCEVQFAAVADIDDLAIGFGMRILDR